MNRLTIGIFSAFGTLVVYGLTTSYLPADDPLRAMPTPKDSVEAKVKRLTEAERKAIALPDDKDQVVFSIAKEAGNAKNQADLDPPEPWIKVFADGRIEARNLVPKDSETVTGQLTKDQVAWLLHLAVNECQALGHSTAKIDADYLQLNDQVSDEIDLSGTFHYLVQVADQTNEFSISERILVVRPIRARMNLAPFASLHTYARFLVAKAYLGKPAEREAIVRKLNEELKEKHPDLPPFTIDHLGAAIRSDTMPLTVGFVHEIELGDNRYRRVSATIFRKPEEEDLTFWIQTMEYSRSRPRR